MQRPHQIRPDVGVRPAAAWCGPAGDRPLRAPRRRWGGGAGCRRRPAGPGCGRDQGPELLPGHREWPARPRQALAKARQCVTVPRCRRGFGETCCSRSAACAKSRCASLRRASACASPPRRAARASALWASGALGISSGSIWSTGPGRFAASTTDACVGQLHQASPARCALSEPRAAAQRVGEHRGLWRYTLGQGARIGGSAQKYFVARKDMERRTLVSGCRRWPTAIPAADAAARAVGRAGALPPSDVLRGRHHVCRHYVGVARRPAASGAASDRRAALPLQSSLQPVAARYAEPPPCEPPTHCRPHSRTGAAATGWCDAELVDAAADEAHPSAGAERGSGAALRLVFHRPQRAVTPGQAVVLYGPALPVETRAPSGCCSRIIAAATIAGAEPLRRAAGHGAGAVSDFVD